ncbi:FeoA domain-containing protein [Mycoplasmatota bacterium WC44]
MLLNKCKPGILYKVVDIKAKEDTVEFLNNLGCRIEEEIVVINKIGSNLVFNVLDGRYGIDINMAKLIEVEKI